MDTWRCNTDKAETHGRIPSKVPENKPKTMSKARPNQGRRRVLIDPDKHAFAAEGVGEGPATGAAVSPTIRGDLPISLPAHRKTRIQITDNEERQ